MLIVRTMLRDMMLAQFIIPIKPIHKYIVSSNCLIATNPIDSVSTLQLSLQITETDLCKS